MSPARVCACGCGESMDGRLPQALYFNDACRARHWKTKVGYGRTDRRPAARSRANGRSGVSRSGLQLSYRKVTRTLTEELTRLGHARPAQRAEEVLAPALSDRQRQRLAEINARRHAC